MGGLDQGRRVTFSPLSPLFYSVLYGCKWKCNSTQNAPYLSWLSIRHAHGPTVQVPTVRDKINIYALRRRCSTRSSEGHLTIGHTIFWSYCLVVPPVMVGYALIAMLITRL